MKRKLGKRIVSLAELTAENERLREKIKRQQKIIRELNLKLDKLEGRA